MTTQAIPDPMGLQTWEEAFQYPLPTVKKLSIRLRKDIDDHRNRLRSLVGASYRDLLGTAERIISMDTQIQAVENDLGNIGRKCNSRILERGDVNYSKLEQTWGDQTGEERELSQAARSRVLTAALAVVERLVKRNGDTLQAAKLMVLSRLLYKSLETDEDEGLRLERFRRRISSLRNRLLPHIDRVLSKTALMTDETAAALSAFALLSSSKLRDVLGHFLAVRSAQLETLADSPSSAVLLESLTLYTDSIQLVHSVFPKRIAEHLSDLGKTALLADPHVIKVQELNLDIYGQWIADDIRSFRPWVQQDAFPGEEARKDVTAFSTTSRAVLLAALEQCLSKTTDASEVLDVRKQLLGTYLNIGSQTKVDGFLDHVQEMRTAFTRHLQTLAVRAGTLEQLDLSPKREMESLPSVWSLADDDFDLSSGGINLRKAVLRSRHGHVAQFDNATAPLQQWLDRVDAFSKALNTMRSTRWDEHFEVDIEEGEEEIAKVFQGKLSVDDPAKVEQSLKSTIDEALSKAYDHLSSTSNGADSPAFLLRVLRSLDRHAALARSSVKSEHDNAAMKQEIVVSLHRTLAQAVSKKSLEAYESKLSTQHYVPADLWEGDPKLPLAPLPVTFRFVTDLQRDMASCNEDVWSVAAVQALKIAAAERLSSVLLVEAQQPDEKPATNGEAQDKAVEPSGSTIEEESVEVTQNGQPEQDEEQQHHQRVQRLFDTLYLSHVFATSKKSALQGSLAKLTSRADLEKAEVRRLQKSANEYWRRTYLLFGLLAPSSTSAAKR